MLRLAAQPRPPLDLGDAAIDLWQHRMDAERDMLASITPAPAELWPAMVRGGIGLPCFEGDYHRITFALLDQHRHEGAVSCARWVGKWCNWQKVSPEFFRDLFDRFPPSAANVEYQAARLRDLVLACRDAERHLAIARQRVADSITRHSGGYANETKHRSPGGNTGGDKHGPRSTLTSARPVKRSA